MKSLIYIFILIFLTTSAYCDIKTDQQMIFNNKPDAEMIANLKKIISPNPFFIPADTVQQIIQEYDLEMNQLLDLLIPIAKTYARPSISGYQVGIATLGKSGNIYLGVNLEFLGVPLNEAIHGEQFAITNARSHGETELVAIALSAAPCGHCRQFLNEMVGSDNLQILVTGLDSTPLSSLLPESFGPKDLGLEGNLLAILDDNFFCEDLDCSLNTQAKKAAVASYAPYSESKSGVAIRVKDGAIYTGSYLENVAFNPSISPLQAALVLLVADGKKYNEIDEVILVEMQSPKISQEAISRELLRNLSPQAIFKIEKTEHL